MTRCAFLGRSTLDLIYRVPEYPQENTKVFASEFIQQAGGPALNAAVAFAQLGGEATLFSAIGSSPVSAAIKDELATYKVAVEDIAEGSAFVPPVAVAWVNAGNGSRTVCNPPAGPAPMHADLRVGLDLNAEMLLIDGFLISSFREVLQKYASQGTAICLDGGSWKAETPSILPFTSIAICSERFTPPGTDTLSSVIDFLHSQGVEKVAITRGDAPILASDAGQRFEIEVEAVNAVDTLGAGDVLHGAFCWYYLQSADFQKALKQAAHAATLSCQSLGARDWIKRLRP